MSGELKAKKTESQVLSVIAARKSTRAYRAKRIEKEKLDAILSAGLLAPSGKNGQPWRFIVIQDDTALKKEISALTVYEPFVKSADTLIVVLLDKTQSYHYVKDVQAIGACIENMLLQATELNVGSCWIGEILNKDIFVKQKLNLSNRYDLMAVLALGYPAEETGGKAMKKNLDECCLQKF